METHDSAHQSKYLLFSASPVAVTSVVEGAATSVVEIAAISSMGM